MRIAEINITYGIGSTGRIVEDLCHSLKEVDIEYSVLCGYSMNSNDENIFSVFKRYPLLDQVNTVLNRFSGLTGYRNRFRTKKAIKWLKSQKPDLIHLHNIHGDWINIFALIEYIKDEGLPVIWTLHDCWSFTGRCSHFELNGCYKWKAGCGKCSFKNVYPKSYLLDFSSLMWSNKKELFCGIESLTIATPSKWLSNYVKESFLNEYPVRVINNGINTDVFNYIENTTIKIEKKIILGVANSWSKTKGLNDFLKLDKMINHKKYQIVLIGLNNRQMTQIPDSIIKVHRTTSADELVDYYRKAFVFLNLTYQDNFPTTNLEALCCGCPVITYLTGGSPESISENTGFVVNQGDVNRVYELIEDINKNGVFQKEEISFNSIMRFSRQNSNKAYIELFKKTIQRTKQ